MRLDLEGILLGMVGGAAIASLITYYLTKGAKGEVVTSKPSEPAPDRLSIPPEKVEEARRELRVLRMEKELLTAALTKLYEAEAQGRIGREEREALVKKYKERLQELQDKISNAAALVELSELENAKEEILRLMNVKLSQIERRLEELRAKVGVTVPKVHEVKEEKVAVERPKRRKKEAEEDKWSKMVEEVNEALARLEQIEIE